MTFKQIALTIFEDIIAVSGIGLLAWGLWELDPWVSKVVVGGILLVGAVISALRR